MEFLETSRSARKMNPTCTSRYRRPNPRATNIVLGSDKSHWETTNRFIQKQVLSGSSDQRKYVRGDRRMTSLRKKGMLQSNVYFGNTTPQWKTESKQHYHYHDLLWWGPRTKIQKDSYSWNEDDRKRLTALREERNADVADVSHYTKLPSIYAKPGSQANGYHDSGYVINEASSGANSNKGVIEKGEERD